MSKELAVISSEKFDTKEIALLRQSYAADLDDTQLKVFLKQCEAMDLNPFTKEIYGMVIKGRLVLITSIGGLRKIAHQSGSYAGCDVRVKMSGPVIESATATIKKIVQGHIAEFTAEVLFKEYNTGQNNWAKMPVTMIKKVAEAAALRMAFPSVENLYEEGELDAMKKKPGTSAETERLTEKFKNSEARDVTQYPDHHEDQALTIAKDVDKPVETVDNPGEYKIRAGKNTGKLIKDVDQKELEEFISWGFTQEKMQPAFAEYHLAAVKFLEQKQGEA